LATNWFVGFTTVKSLLRASLPNPPPER
jgi:hypothetical protein